jgi:undecaprenyl pyrophosphate synthase
LNNQRKKSKKRLSLRRKLKRFETVFLSLYDFSILNFRRRKKKTRKKKKHKMELYDIMILDTKVFVKEYFV